MALGSVMQGSVGHGCDLTHETHSARVMEHTRAIESKS